LFLNIRVKSAANLNKLEEVLVVTRLEEKEITPSQNGPLRAADILAQRLPTVPDKPAADALKTDKNASQPPTAQGNAQTGVTTRPASGPVTATPKLAGTTQTAPGPVDLAPAASGTPVKASTAPAGGKLGESPTGVSDAVAHAPSANPNPAAVKPATAQRPLTPIVKVFDKGSKATTAGRPKSDSTSGDQKADQAPTDQVKPEQVAPVPNQQTSPKPEQPAADQSKPDQPPPQNRRP
jgi:hypothetical protein